MNPEQILAVTDHRPYPLPAGPWMLRQTWHDLLFAHWAVEPERVRAAMPEAVRPYLDKFEGKAWVGVIPFWMSGVRTRGLPPVPTTSTFPELNVRTYVSIDRKPGVYFFSLDAASLLAVMGARAGFALKYFYASMRCEVTGDNVRYSSKRIQSPRPAEARIERNTMAAASGLALPEAAPVLHFAKRMDVLIWWPERVDRG